MPARDISSFSLSASLRYSWLGRAVKPLLVITMTMLMPHDIATTSCYYLLLSTITITTTCLLLGCPSCCCWHFDLAC